MLCAWGRSEEGSAFALRGYGVTRGRGSQRSEVGACWNRLWIPQAEGVENTHCKIDTLWLLYTDDCAD